MSGQRELIIGKTVIGRKEIPGNPGTFFLVHFGNYLTPHKGGSFQHLEYDEYLEMLDSFLKSREGKEYKAPTEAEIANAIQIVIEKESVATKKYAAIKEQAPAIKDSSPIYITEDIPEEFKTKEDPEDFEDDEEPKKTLEKRKGKKTREENENIKGYKRQIAILTIAVIFLTLVVALQMLLNLFLLTR